MVFLSETPQRHMPLWILYWFDYTLLKEACKAFIRNFLRKNKLVKTVFRAVDKQFYCVPLLGTQYHRYLWCVFIIQHREHFVNKNLTKNRYDNAKARGGLCRGGIYAARLGCTSIIGRRGDLWSPGGVMEPGTAGGRHVCRPYNVLVLDIPRKILFLQRKSAPGGALLWGMAGEITAWGTPDRCSGSGSGSGR